MSKVVPLARTSSQAPASADEKRVEQTVALATTLIESLPADERDRFLQSMLGKARAAVAGPRAGEALSTILEFLPMHKHWKASTIKQMMHERGAAASSKEVYNALHYLARRGSLRRIGYGIYEFNGVLFETSDNFGLEPHRHEDVADDDRRDHAENKGDDRR